MWYNGLIKLARSLRALGTMLARHAVLLTPSVTARLSRPSREAEHTFRATNPLPAVQYCLKSFRCNTCAASCKCSIQTAYRHFKPFRCNTYTNAGGGGPRFRNSPLGTHHSPLQSSPFLSHSCALFCTPKKLNLFVFNRFRTLCPKRPGGVSVFAERTAPKEVSRRDLSRPYLLTSLPPYFLTSRNGNALPAAMGAAAKRAYRLQERSSCPALNQLSGGGGGGGASGPPLNW